MRISGAERDKAHLQDILEAITGIERTLQAERKDFFTERAMERCFEILGEACKRVSPALKEQYPAIPWGNIIALRNVISHEYEKIDCNTLWDIAKHKIPALKDWISGILASDEKGTKP